jgi:hypothetical protein
MSSSMIKAFHEASHGNSITFFDIKDPKTLVALHYTYQFSRAIIASSGNYHDALRDLSALSGSISGVLEVDHRIRTL